jgi:integral membrane protein
VGTVAVVNTRKAFRTVAIAEAISWAGLLTAMFFKWVVAADPHTGAEGGVPIMGPIHGVVFLAYVVMCVVARRSFGWSNRVTLLALAASIPPFFTYVFEVVAERKDLLRKSERILDAIA